MKEDSGLFIQGFLMQLLLQSPPHFPLLYPFKKSISFYLFLATLGHHCCMRAFSSCRKQGLLPVVVCSFSLWCLLLLWNMGSRAHGLCSCGAWAYLLCGIWDLSRPGIKPMSPTLAGGFLTTGLPEKYLHPPPIPFFLAQTYTCWPVF